MDTTKKKAAAVAELRKRVEHKLPPLMNKDFELRKWLAARNYDVNKAEDMLLKSIEWRKEWDADTLTKWEPPEVLVKYYPVGMSGFDKEGCPVWIVPYGEADVRGALQCCSKRDCIRRTIQVLETSLEVMREKSKDREVPITQQVFIFDLENFSLRLFTWKPALDIILQLVQLYEANYPEILKCAFVVNAPKLFAIAYALVKPFLEEATIKKIQIYGRTGWKEPILEMIDADQVPVHWGGTMRDPDGHEKCPSKICLGGEIPKSYYMKHKKQKEGVPTHLKSLTLSKSDKKVFEFEIDCPGTILKWEFQTADYDIGFGISSTLTSGEEEVILGLQRVNSHLVPEEGSIVCTDVGTYKVIFDNEYSYVNSKTLYYDIELSPPVERTQF